MEILLQFLPTIVTIGTAILGWNVIYRNAKKLVTRGETKALVDEVTKICSSLEEEMVSFWLQESNDRKDPRIFLLVTGSKIDSLLTNIELLEKREVPLDKRYLMELKTFIDLDCERVDTLSIEQRSSQVQEFLNKKRCMLNALYESFETRYEPSKKYGALPPPPPAIKHDRK